MNIINSKRQAVKGKVGHIVQIGVCRSDVNVMRRLADTRSPETDVSRLDYLLRHRKGNVVVLKCYNRVFSHDVTAAILVSQNNETAATLVSQTNPLGVVLFSYANAFFCFNKFA